MTEHPNAPVWPGHDELPGLPSRALSPAQQLEALRKVQAQAEQRVKLGVQLFRAAEARVASQQRIIDEIKAEQSKLREQVQDDVGRSLHAYDQWVGQIDESFTEALQALESRLDGLSANWSRSEARFEEMLAKSEAMLDQTRQLVRQVAEQAKVKPEPRPAPPPACAEPSPQPAAPTPEPVRAAVSPEPPDHPEPGRASAETSNDQPQPTPRAPQPVQSPAPPQAASGSSDGEAPPPATGEEIFSRVIDRLRAQDKGHDQGDKAA